MRKNSPDAGRRTNSKTMVMACCGQRFCFSSLSGDEDNGAMAGWSLSFCFSICFFLFRSGSSTRFSLSCSSSVRFSLHTLCFFFLGLCLCSFFFFVCSFCVFLVFVHMFFLRSPGYSFSPLRVPLCVCSSSALWFSRLCSLFVFLPRVPVFFLPLVSSVFFARFSTAREG